MSHSEADFRKNRPASLLASKPFADVPEQEDAVSRHGRARALRERRASPLLGATPPESAEHEPVIAEPREDAPVDISLPEAEPQARELPETAERQPRGVVAGIAGLTLAGALAGGVAAFAWPQTYVATAEMLIAPDAAPLSADAALTLVDNQVRIIRSGTMLNAAAERLNLAADAEFNGAGGMLAELGDLIGGADAGTVEQRRRHAVGELARTVQVGRAGAGSVVTVAAQSGDPQKAALIANTISELFVENAGREPGDSGQRVAELRAAVAEAERAIEAFKAQNELVDAQGRLITDDEIVRLGEQLSAARARTVELNARAASTREANVDSIVTGSLPEQYASPTLAELRARHAAAKQQLDRLSARLGPRHPERLAAEAELEGARQEITAELRRVASSLQTELRRAVQQEQELSGQLARMKVRQGNIGDDLVRLRELEREAENRRIAYDRALGATQAGASAPGAAAIISRAEPPVAAQGPSAPALSLAGAVAGLLAGLGFAGWRTRRDELPERDIEPAAADDVEPQADTPADMISHDAGKEADAMHHPYAPHHPAQPEAAQPAAPAAGQPYPQQAMPPQPAMYPAAHAYPPHPAHMQQPHWQAMPYPAPQPPYGYWQAAQQPQPVMPTPYDPWGRQQAYAPPPYQPQPYAPPVQAFVYAPAPQQQAPAAPPPGAQAAPRPQEERWQDQDAFIDERTNAAIDEIRRSLREFREAIEDFADERDRQGHRRFGT